ncbi:MAG TPA: DNRLRE domain-containing protein [Thermomicrobiales bacterium]|nr:DNRLRE domain-containing protein [Thermomicrobiales bacterium]
MTNRTAPGSRAGTSAVPHRWLTGILVALMVLINVQTIPAPVSAQIVRQQCGRQGPADGSFVADVCFTTPTDGAILSGDVNINVSVTQVSGVMPKVELVRFYFARSTATTPPSLLTDYAEPWGLTLPTDHWKDTDAESKPVTYQIAARVKFANGYETIDPTTYARIFVDFENGRTSDEQNNGTWAPKTSGTSPLTVVATGDGAGGLPGATAVGNLVTGMNPDLFLYLGDVYNAGKYAEFYNYYEPTLGALKARTNPVPGNHEGGGDQFKGYLDYWDSTKHYYSYDSGGWHFIALDSTAEYGQLGPGSTQYEWLVQDLQANANTACTMVFFHHPRFGLVTNATDVTHRGNLQTIWSLLATSGVDVVLNGHEHNYQRWKPMDANGTVVADGSGPRQFIIGTAGHDLQGFGGTDSRIAARISGMDGALKLSLTPAGGSAQFVGTNGTVQDSSSFTCNGAQPPSGPITFGPDADALVQQALPDQNAGTSTSLRADKSPNEESYLRFNVQAGSQPITRATLRLWVRDGTADAPGVARSDSVTWSESGITWNTKPAYGPIGADVRQATTNTWLEYDVTSLVTGNGPVTFALVPQSTDGLTVDAKESGSNTPQLVLNGNPVPSQPPPAPAPTGDVEVKAAADARVQEANPTINYGTDPLLRADGGVDPDVETYLKFSVSGLSGAPTTAKIALFINEGGNAGSVDGPALYSAPSTWQETTITWNNRTTRGTTAFGDFGAVTAGSWVVYDVSSAITGNGEYTFVLATTSNDATDFDSRETANTPRLLLSGITSQPPPEPSTTALKPVADAMVQQGLPDTNAGTSTSMRADLVPNEASYLRFDVPTNTAPITKATLRLWVRDNTSGTVDAPAVARSADVTWGETTITWNNRPAVGSPGPNFGAVGINTWIEYDVTSLVTGNGPVTLVLVPESSDAMVVNTRENPTNKPELVITRGTGGQTPTDPPSAAAPVLLAAGDIASCGSAGTEGTANLLDTQDGTVLTLGDHAYPEGSATDFANCYQPTWGRHKTRTRPVPGNHDYMTAGASAYFAYFGQSAGDPGKGYYSYDVAGWHVVALNSNIDMSVGSAQEQWLRTDLAANPTACTVAYMHHPRYSSGAVQGGSTTVQPVWQALYEAGVEVVLAGHDHTYERLSPMDPNGNLDPAFGIRQFVVGTGGATHYQFGAAVPGSEVRIVDTFGILKLSLNSGSYRWDFLPAAGGTSSDSGTGTCHGPVPAPEPPSTVTPPATTVPSAPTTLTAVADAMVQQGLPDTNAGTANSMRADTQPVEVSYLRFDIPADPGQITKAMLRLWVRDNTSGTIDAPAIATSNDVTWSETGITWNNRPAVGPPGPNAGAVGINTWIEYDVTSLVTGNGPVTLVLVPESTDGMIVNTRENTTNTPQLVISRGTGSGTPPATADAATPPAPATPTATTPPSSAETRAFEPLADAMVLEAVPNENHGSDPVLHADQGPSEMSYLRFDVQTGGAAISKATLRLWVDSGTVDGPAVAGSSDVTWGEGTITWAARPTIGGAVADAGVVASGSWLEYNVTSLVTVDGLVTMVLVPQSTDGISMSSREAVTNHPQLVVTYSGIAGTSSASRSLAPAVATQPSATSTVAATPTATPQVTPTVAASTPSPTPTAIATEGNLPTATSTPAATPLPVVDGWQTDPAQPWTRLTDADPTSVWTAPLGLPPDRAEIGIDLGAVMALGHLRLLPAPPYQGMVTIELSADSVTWYHLTDVRLGEPGAPDEWVEVPAGYGARFARLVLTNPPAGGIAELELWAAPAGAVRPLEQLPPVVPTAASTEAPLPSDAPLPTAVPIVEPTPAPPTEAPVIPAPEPTAALTPEPTAAPPVEPTLEVPTDPATPSGGT